MKVVDIRIEKEGAQSRKKFGILDYVQKKTKCRHNSGRRNKKE